MNASALTKNAGLGALLAIALGLGTSTLSAGPGSEYWRNLGQPKPVGPATAVKLACPLGEACPDAKVIEVYQVKPAWHNGRGPLQSTFVGTKTICTTCGGTTTEMRSTTANGRPPMVPVTVPAKHDCGRATVVALN